MQILLPKLLKSGWTSPSCSKCCSCLKQVGLSKGIQPNLVKKCTKSGHTDPNPNGLIITLILTLIITFILTLTITLILTGRTPHMAQLLIRRDPLANYYASFNVVILLPDCRTYRHFVFKLYSSSTPGLKSYPD